MYETYLPAFEAAVTKGKVAGMMGAYNRVNGEPACGSKVLLQDILKEEWGFDGYVVSDCWAIRDFHTEHMVTHTATESAALAINNGCQLNCGNTYLHMLQAYKEGLVTEETITKSAQKLMAIRMKLGLFDKNCEYNKIPYEVNDCKVHRDIALDVARRSMVLLKNNGILPLNLKQTKAIGVIGPTANSRTVLQGNYFGTASRYTTFLEGIQDYVGDAARVYYAEGCHLFKNSISGLSWENDRLSEALIVAEQSDVVILCLGLDASIEGEQGDTGNAFAAGDKSDLNLIGRQQLLLEEVLKIGKPTILILSSGSAMAIHTAQEYCEAILETWYPGQSGGKALAQLLFGEYSPSGKLPITFYKTTEELPDFRDYSMAGRTYRYMKNEALYPFGYGLNYAKVEVKDAVIKERNIENEIIYEIQLQVTNQSEVCTYDVVQVYIKDMESRWAVPNYSLCAYKSIYLAAYDEPQITLQIKQSAFEIVDEEGKRYIDSHHFKLFIGTSGPDKRSVELTGRRPIIKEIYL